MESTEKVRFFPASIWIGREGLMVLRQGFSTVFVVMAISARIGCAAIVFEAGR